ncbi:hypothetical protein CLOSTASPAR_06504 [[Clostridium] asparagiforme DSM 15981]|uniref:Uncharacterized protein n=1 Tax=[Clostridium] asparagiforme DSM 15981 TaxID=518636 RepID=C0DB49_9FIRM|nr:hypothetical protein CLOSTASPAR_06504 [[Clostridium] asparagiforme DSM 15981]
MVGIEKSATIWHTDNNKKGVDSAGDSGRCCFYLDFRKENL